MVFLAVMVLGMVSYFKLPIQLFPDITFPTIGVFVRNDKSTKDNLEEITKKIEGIAAEMSRVKGISSHTRAGSVWIRVDFEYGTDIQYAQVDLEERLNSFRQSLDDRRTVINAFPFSSADFQATYMSLAVRGKGDTDTLFRTASEKVEEQLKSISGVSNVEISGTTAQQVQVELNTDMMASFGLDIGQVISRVQSVASEDTFLGRLMVPGETHYVRLNDRIATIDQLANVIVDTRGVVRLRDVADIYAGTGVDRRISRSDGKNSIRIRMEREADRNLIDLAQATRERVGEINLTLPPGVELTIEQDAAKYVEEAIAEVRNLAGVGALLALLVPLVFFRSLRVALIVFLSVPTCLIAVFNLFYVAGMSINVLSIVGLALGVGMLVDNSIVVVENSFRLFGLGFTPRDAATQGGVEVGRGLLASTLTTVVVFVPFAFLEGEFRLIVKEPALALVFPLLMSLAVALTIVPVFVYIVLRTKRRGATASSHRLFFDGPFRAVLKGAMRNRARVLFAIAVALAFTWLESCSRIREASSSRQSSNEYMELELTSPQGSTLSEMDRAVRVVEDRLSKHPDIKTFSVGFRADEGDVDIILKPLEEREDRKSYQEIRAGMIDFVGEVPGLEISFWRQSMPMDSPPVNLGNQGSMELKGLDLDVIHAQSERVIDAIRAHPSITGAKLEEDRSEPEYLAMVDREKTGLFDVKAQALGRYVSATRSNGTISSLQLINGDERTDVSFIIEAADGSTVQEVQEMAVVSGLGGTVPLGELTNFQASQSERRIRRTNRQSSASLVYFYDPKADFSALKEDVKKIVARVPNPGGVSIEMTGEAQKLDQRMADFIYTVLMGGLFVYIVMAAVFESFWVPFAILATVPLTLIGIVWALDMMGLPLDDMAAFGVILLVGLAVNNGIVLMDRALMLQRDGYSRTRAVYDASITRLRPILMTYLTTVLGLLPLAIVGEEGDQWRPVAVVVIGGLTSATILTLIVLPCFYLIGDDFVRWARRPFLTFLGVLLEITEACTNTVMHPIRVLRRQIRLAPTLWPFLGAVSRLAFEVLRTPARLLFRAPGDSIFVAGYFLRGDRRGLKARQASRLARWRSAIWSRVRAPFAWIAHRVGRKARGMDAQDVVSPVGEASPLQLRNIQVIFSTSHIAALRTKLPKRIGGTPRGAGSVHALRGVTLEMKTGIFGLLGPNGAGKTTLMRAMAGVLEPTRGSVRVFGLSHRDAPGLLAPLIGYLPQNHGHYDWMTLRQYLDYFATLTAGTLSRARSLGTDFPALSEHLGRLSELADPHSRRTAVDRAMAEVNLGHVADQRIGTFSGGMKQRAGIARLILQAPPILLVDEPTAGLDPIERVNVRLLLARLAEKHLIVLSTHIVEDLEQNCDTLAILDKGEIIYHGGADELRARCAGLVWDVPSQAAAREDFRSRLVAGGGRVLYQVLARDIDATRVLSKGSPAPGAVPVSATLEVALLVSLSRGAVAPVA